MVNITSSKGEPMSTSTKNNTLQNYLTKYIEQTFAAHTGNRYDKLYRELLSKVEETIKLAVSKAKHLDISLESVYGELTSNKKLLHAIAKQQVSTFLDTHQTKKGIVEGFSKHNINESDLKILEEGKGLVKKINDINLIQQNEENKLNISNILAQSIGHPSSQIKESEVTSVNILDVVK